MEKADLHSCDLWEVRGAPVHPHHPALRLEEQTDAGGESSLRSVMHNGAKRRRLGANDRFEMDWKQKRFVAVGEGLRYAGWGIAALAMIGMLSILAFVLLAVVGKQYGPFLLGLITDLRI